MRKINIPDWVISLNKVILITSVFHALIYGNPLSFVLLAITWTNEMIVRLEW